MGIGKGTTSHRHADLPLGRHLREESHAPLARLHHSGDPRVGSEPVEERHSCTGRVGKETFEPSRMREWADARKARSSRPAVPFCADGRKVNPGYGGSRTRNSAKTYWPVGSGSAVRWRRFFRRAWWGGRMCSNGFTALLLTTRHEKKIGARHGRAAAAGDAPFYHRHPLARAEDRPSRLPAPTPPLAEKAKLRHLRRKLSVEMGGGPKYVGSTRVRTSGFRFASERNYSPLPLCFPSPRPCADGGCLA